MPFIDFFHDNIRLISTKANNKNEIKLTPRPISFFTVSFSLKPLSKRLIFMLTKLKASVSNFCSDSLHCVYTGNSLWAQATENMQYCKILIHYKAG